MRVISPGMFRVIFGVHAFIPFMMHMHKILPATFYARMGYLVFSFLFNWTEERWDRGLRNRMFQFAPVYVSAECMRWWLGPECFATQKCILATREESRMEEQEDSEEDSEVEYYQRHKPTKTEERKPETKDQEPRSAPRKKNTDRGRHAWYNDQAPPMAFWVAGADDLVDGGRLLRRFERGREPHVDVVHSKIIEGYEHLDVIWAIDSIEKVASEVKEVIWKTAPKEAKKRCRVPQGCENVQPWHGHREIGESKGAQDATKVESTAGRWSEEQDRNRQKRLEFSE